MAAGAPEQFILQMVDQISGPAKAAQGASGALERQMRNMVEKAGDLSAKLSAEKSMLAKLQAGYLDNAAAAGTDAAKVEKLQLAILKQHAAVTKATRSLRDHTEKSEDLGKKTKKSTSIADGITEAFGDMGMKALAIAAPLAAVGAAIGFLKVGFEAAFDTANFKTQTTAQLESMTGSAEKAKQTFNHIQRIADELVIGNDRAAKMSTDLMKNARLPRVKLEESITALVALERGQGADASAKLESIIKGHALKRTFAITREDAMAMGTNMKEVYKEIADRTGQGVDVVRMKMMQGRISARQGLDAMNSLLSRKNKAALEAGKLDPTAMFAKAKETFKRLFEDVNLQPILKSIQSFILLFDRSTASGRGMKTILTAVFNTVGKIGAFAFKIVREGLVWMTIGALKFYITAFPLINSIYKLFQKLGGNGEGGAAFLGKVISGAFDIAAISLKNTITVATAIFDIFNDFVDLISGPAIYNAVQTILGFFKDGFSFDAFMNLGGYIIDGIIAGMKYGLGKMAAVAVDIKDNVVGSFKSAFGIHSPAKATEPLGGHIMGGMGVGAKKNPLRLADHVDTSLPPVPTMQGPSFRMGSMAAPSFGGGMSGAAGALGQGMGAAASASGGGSTITLEAGAVVIHASNGETAQQIFDMLPGALTKQIENVAMQLGQPTKG